MTSSSEAGRLVAKALRSLPEEEQAELLAYLFQAAAGREHPPPADAGRRQFGQTPQLHTVVGPAAREIDVIRRLAGGDSIGDIARALGIDQAQVCDAVDTVRARVRMRRPRDKILGLLACELSLAEVAQRLSITEEAVRAELTEIVDDEEAWSGRLARGSGVWPAPASAGGRRALQVRLEDELFERLKRWCDANGFSIAVVIRGLVEDFLARQDRRAS